MTVVRANALLLLLSSVLLISGNVRAQDAQPSEYQVKAAFIFNFIRFTEWPPDAFAESTSPLTIGVLGESPFGAELERAVQTKTINNHAMVVTSCRTLAEAKRCQVLFISVSENHRLAEIFEGLGEAHVLTVGETENFIKSGGMINFYREGNKFRFEINDAATKRVGLKIDSKLLGLSKKPSG